MNGYQDALERACATAGLGAGGARLLRLGSNTVYRLKAPVVVRISRPSADIEHARRTMAVARWLESISCPAVRVVHVDQPVDVDGHVAESARGRVAIRCVGWSRRSLCSVRAPTQDDLVSHDGRRMKRCELSYKPAGSRR